MKMESYNLIFVGGIITKITFVFGITVDFADNPSLFRMLYLQNRQIIIESVAFKISR